MPDKNVQLPDGRVVSFPDSMADADISAVIKKQMAPDKPQSTIGPREETVPSHIPFAAQAHQAVQSLEDWSNMTQEGREQHPVQAAVGDFARNLKQYLVGGQGGGVDLKTGVVTNPVLAGVTGVPEEESLNLIRGSAQAVKRAIASPFRAAATSETGRAVTQTLAPELVHAPVSTGQTAATTGGAATKSITANDVLQHAHDLGIKLTPAQALQTSAAKSEQVLGEEALLTGSKIKAAAAAEKGKLDNAISEFQDRLDPQRLGMSSESTGEHLQNSAEISRSVLKDNVNQAYADVKAQQADLAGDVRKPLEDLIHSETFARQPHAAVEQPVFQTSAAKAAIKDIQDMLADPAMQGRQSVQSLRNLRTTLLEKANDYGANALSDSGQRIYKLAAGQVDRAIMDSAAGTPFEGTFRTAGQQNAKLQDLYNTRNSPLYRILNTDDPAKVADGILTRSSVHEIETLRGENFDLGPLARQAVEDIKNGGFKVTPNGLGGYPDTFLRSLLGPEATKELYLKAQIAKRLSENYNASGSGKVILGAAQFNPKIAVAAQVARSRSMPQDALNFLPKSATSPLTGGPLSSPEELFRHSANQ